MYNNMNYLIEWPVTWKSEGKACESWFGVHICIALMTWLYMGSFDSYDWLHFALATLHSSDIACVLIKTCLSFCIYYFSHGTFSPGTLPWKLGTQNLIQPLSFLLQMLYFSDACPCSLFRLITILNIFYILYTYQTMLIIEVIRLLKIINNKPAAVTSEWDCFIAEHWVERCDMVTCAVLAQWLWFC